MKKTLVLFSTLLLCGVGLTSCRQKEEPVTYYEVTLDAQEGSSIVVTNELSEDKEMKFVAGTTVEFSVSVEDTTLNQLTSVLVDDVTLALNESGDYKFAMPMHDVVIKTTVFSVGDGSLLKVADVKEEEVPTDLAGVVNKLDASVAQESVYVKESTLKGDYQFDSSFYKEYSIKSRVNRDGGVVAKGNVRKSEYNAMPESYYYQSGILADEKHAFKLEGSGTSDNHTFSLTPTIFTVVSDDAESVGQKEKTLTDARAMNTAYGFSKTLRNTIFKDDASQAFNESTYCSWKDISVDSKVAEDKKSYTVTLSANYTTYSGGYERPSMALTFNGNGVLTHAEFKKDEYAAGSWDKENNTLVDGATIEGTTSLTYEATIGYKDAVELKYDINDFVLNDYEVVINSKMLREDTIYNADASKIEAGSTLSFKFVSEEDTMFAIRPTIVSVSEGFATVDSYGESLTVDKVGDFVVSFDNGLGKIFEKHITAVQPVGREIELSVNSSSNLFANSDNEVVVKVIPTPSKQESSLTVDTSKTGGVEATITPIEGQPGHYNVVPSATGKLYLLATAENGSLTSSVTVNVIEKPSKEGILATLTSKTLKAYNRNIYGTDYINFNADGTGQYENSDDGVMDFTWTLDETTFKFDLVFDIEGKTNYNIVTDFAATSNTTFSGTFFQVYYGSEYTDFVNFTLTDRRSM